jgi:hypothetical protein
MKARGGAGALPLAPPPPLPMAAATIDAGQTLAVRVLPC